MQTYTDHMVLEGLKQNISSLDRLVRKFEAAGNPWTAAQCRDQTEDLRGYAAEIERRGIGSGVKPPLLKLVK